MHIEKFEDAIMNCRFCFMCRHLSAIGNVRHTEADTPRVRAAMLYGLRTGTNSFDDTDFVDALYRQDLSACCVRHCVNHFDENGLALDARAVYIVSFPSWSISCAGSYSCVRMATPSRTW